MPVGTARLRVPELLKKKGWTISELMHRSGLSYPTVFRLAHGAEGSVSLDTAMAIAKAFGVSLEDLIEEESG